MHGCGHVYRIWVVTVARGAERETVAATCWNDHGTIRKYPARLQLVVACSDVLDVKVAVSLQAGLVVEVVADLDRDRLALRPLSRSTSSLARTLLPARDVEISLTYAEAPEASVS